MQKFHRRQIGRALKSTCDCPECGVNRCGDCTSGDPIGDALENSGGGYVDSAHSNDEWSPLEQCSQPMLYVHVGSRKVVYMDGGIHGWRYTWMVVYMDSGTWMVVYMEGAWMVVYMESGIHE